MGAVQTIIDRLTELVPDFIRSDGQIEAKIIDVVGTYADSEAIERDNTLATINAALTAQKVTAREYYRRKAVAYQQGYDLSYDPVNLGAYYETIDETAQIVKQAYIVGGYPYYTLLVNAVGADGFLRPLTAAELASFRTYFEAFQPIGLNLNVNSLEVARIYDPGVVVYVRAGSSAQEVAGNVNRACREHESRLRTINAITLGEISDVMQAVPSVVGVGFSQPYAVESRIDGSTATIWPQKGLFDIQNGAGIFATEITVDNIRVLH